MDAFYPAVEVLDHPHLKGKPVIVGGIEGRGVVSSASYEARRFGVHSAQPMTRAMRLCPRGVFLPVRMSRYKEVSRQVFEIFHRFTPLVEPLSIDEAFLDVTGSGTLFGDAVEIAKRIKTAVREEIGLTVSAGVAPSKFVAKIASDLEKPDGLTVVSPDKVRDFLDPLPIKKMWGAGKVTQGSLARLNVRTFRDLRLISPEVLEKAFGEYGRKMHLLAQGIDERQVVPEHDAKSIGHEETFLEDITDSETAKKELLSLAYRVARRMRRSGAKGRTVTLKVKYHDFVQVTRAETLDRHTDDGQEIYMASCRLLEKTGVGKRPVRLLGISMSHLGYSVEVTQLDLFGGHPSVAKRDGLHKALDALYEKHGEKSIRPGTLIKHE